ncbi:hypothetical protein J6590_014540 [Homalodisca vitripennis]|nr:hypothetical protein J6590_014540 [Homalodisca vitripennis]
MSPAPGVSMMEESAATVNVSLLDKFRKEASFDWEKMRLNIEDPELLAVKVSVPTFPSSPIIPLYSLKER